ncbi:hypothetical protein MNBD_GAMMA16-485 [hydrothermal vent metagenome]|uniref:Response regulatory domain-containing protein n=1 Tax=hydrothermal vent metagenome TaxID=652676 RepID=A0A3B0Z8S7_9ZZZZ
MNGIQLLNCLKASTETRHISVHIISVDEPENDTIQRGTIGFSQKPVSKQQLDDVFESMA